MKHVSVGFVGTGNIAESAQRAFRAIPGVTVSAVCAPDSARRQSFCLDNSIEHAVDTLEELLTLPIDAVFIATPNVFHPSQAALALLAGKHVLLDKPLSVNLQEARCIEEVVTRAAAPPVFLLGMDLRFTTEAERLRRSVREAEFGGVREVRAVWRRKSGIPRLGSWFGHRALSGGGVVLDLGVHLLDLALYVMDDFEVASVTAEVSTLFGSRGVGGGDWGKSNKTDFPFDVEDTATATLRMKSGLAVRLELAWAADIPEDELRDLEFHGTAGVARFDFESRSKPPENRYAHFIAMIREGGEPLVTLEQALKVQAVLDGIYESARLGREVRLSSLSP